MNSGHSNVHVSCKHAFTFMGVHICFCANIHILMREQLHVFLAIWMYLPMSTCMFTSKHPCTYTEVYVCFPPNRALFGNLNNISIYIFDYKTENYFKRLVKLICYSGWLGIYVAIYLNAYQCISSAPLSTSIWVHYHTLYV